MSGVELGAGRNDAVSWKNSNELEAERLEKES
jgi:hypothetical protein